MSKNKQIVLMIKLNDGILEINVNILQLQQAFLEHILGLKSDS